MSELQFDAARPNSYNLYICNQSNIFASNRTERGCFLWRTGAYNFAAGPAVMPEPALRRAQSELLNWHGCGKSVMEMSHRGKQFAEIHAEAKERFKRLLGVPDTHEVLFLQAGRPPSSRPWR